jgi:hypothetical protein
MLRAKKRLLVYNPVTTLTDITHSHPLIVSQRPPRDTRLLRARAKPVILGVYTGMSGRDMMLSIVDILSKLEAQLGPDLAQLQLAASLTALQLPVKFQYTPEEVMAIAARIIENERAALRESGIPEMQALEEVIAPVLDSFKDN